MIAAYQNSCQSRVDAALETLLHSPRPELERLYAAMRLSLIHI